MAWRKPIGGAGGLEQGKAVGGAHSLLVGQHEDEVAVLQAVADVDVPVVRGVRHVVEDKAHPAQRLDSDGHGAVLVLDAPCALDEEGNGGA